MDMIKRFVICSFLLVVLVSSAFSSEGVILLHGLCRTSASMEKMKSALTEAGYSVVNVDYPSRTASIEQLSETVVSSALMNPSLSECSTIHFVTHSLGGILVRVYFSKNTDRRLGRVVMLGPPNQGSEVVDNLKEWKVFQKLNGPAGSELGTDDQSKPSVLGAVEFELGVIAGDRSINWINSMMIPGSDDGKVSIESTKVDGMKEHLVIHCTHPYIMKNRKVIESVICFLRNGSFEQVSTCGRVGYARSLGRLLGK